VSGLELARAKLVAQEEVGASFGTYLDHKKVVEPAMKGMAA